MPTYEYRCKDCDHEFEVVQSFSDAALTECPSCGGNLRKVFGNVGITFKGSGFYKTDSRATQRQRHRSRTRSPTATPAPRRTRRRQGVLVQGVLELVVLAVEGVVVHGVVGERLVLLQERRVGLAASP